MATSSDTQSPEESPDRASFHFRIGETEWDFWRFEGEEGVSRLFEYRLYVMSEAAVAAEQVVGMRGLLSFDMAERDESGGHPKDFNTARYVNGMVSAMTYVGVSSAGYHYELDLVPVFWLLTRRRRCRIFQNKNVQEIVEQIFGDAEIPSTLWKFALSKEYPKRDYCVQYRESEWDFIQRLLEQEGIFYYFEHDDTNHELVMCDDSSIPSALDGDASDAAIVKAGDHMLAAGHAAGHRHVSRTGDDPVGQGDARRYGILRPRAGSEQDVGVGDAA